MAVAVIVSACGADADDDASVGVDGEAEAASTRDETGPTSSSAPTEDDDLATTATTRPTTEPTPTTSNPTSSVTSDSTSSGTSTSSAAPGRDGPELVDIRSVPIFSARALGPATLELTVEGGVEPCFIIDRVEVVESGERVELTVHAGSEPGAICIQIIELHTTTVELDQALGGRGVVDGTTGLPLDVVS